MSFRFINAACHERRQVLCLDKHLRSALPDVVVLHGRDPHQARSATLVTHAALRPLRRSQGVEAIRATEGEGGLAQ